MNPKRLIELFKETLSGDNCILVFRELGNEKYEAQFLGRKVYFTKETPPEIAVSNILRTIFLGLIEEISKKGSGNLGINKERLMHHLYYNLGYIGRYIRTQYENPNRHIPDTILDKVYKHGLEVDHARYLDSGRLIIEPYEYTMDDFKKLIEFCEENGAVFYATGESYHFPGHTLRIVIVFRDKEGVKRGEEGHPFRNPRNRW